MKKLVTILLATIMAIAACFALTACGKASDLETVKKNGKIVVGVTLYEPMDYLDADNEWTGFDAELAKEFAKELDVNCQIVIITWGQKVAELNAKQIDLIWNGMTASDELGKEIDFSVSYAKNAQVAVVKNDSAITTKEQIKSAKVAVESGSAGNAVATEEQFANVIPVTAQVDAVNEVIAGTSDVAIIDITMAQSVIGKGKFSNLKVVENVSYGDEIFAVGLRKGSDIKEKLDSFLKAKYKDGSLSALAEKYSVGLNTKALES